MFDDRLPACLITLQRQSRTFGYYSRGKFTALNGEAKTDELALNPTHFRSRSLRETCSTLVHEMVHLAEAHFGTPGRNGYHSRSWAKAMKAIGLCPSSTGRPGGRETGYSVSHYIIEGGPFALAFDALETTIEWGDTLFQEASAKPKAKRLKFVCPSCNFSVQASPSAAGKLACIPCGHVEIVAA